MKSQTITFSIKDMIFEYDEENSGIEDRYDTIGNAAIGTMNPKEDILFVVYADRSKRIKGDKEIDVIRLISARYATEFERGLYYGNFNY